MQCNFYITYNKPLDTETQRHGKCEEVFLNSSNDIERGRSVAAAFAFNVFRFRHSNLCITEIVIRKCRGLSAASFDTHFQKLSNFWDAQIVRHAVTAPKGQTLWSVSLAYVSCRNKKGMRLPAHPRSGLTKCDRLTY